MGKITESAEGRLEWIDDNKLLNLNLWEGDRFFIEWLEKDAFFSGKFCYKDGALINHKMVIYSDHNYLLAKDTTQAKNI